MRKYPRRILSISGLVCFICFVVLYGPLVLTQVADAEEVDKITLRTLFAKGYAGEEEIRQLAKDYHEKNPNIDVEIVYTDWTSFQGKLMIELVGGTGRFDFLFSLTSWLPPQIRGGYLEPLNAYIKKDTPEGWPNDWSNALLDPQTDKEGNLYGFPHHQGPILLWYRRDLFENPEEKLAFRNEYGYELRAPETWREFIDVAKFFTRDIDNDGVVDSWGIVWGLTKHVSLPHKFFVQLYSRGGKYLDEGMKPVVNSEIGIEALQFMVDQVDKFKICPREALGFTGTESGDFYLGGKAAMLVDWSHIGAWAELPEKSKIVGKNASAVVPKGSGPKGQHKSYFEYWILSMPKAGKHKEETYKFMKYLISKKGEEILALTGGIPSRISTLTNPKLVKRFPFYATIGKQIMSVGVPPTIPEWPELNDSLTTAISSAIIQTKTPKEALDEAAEQAEKLLQKAGYYE